MSTILSTTIPARPVMKTVLWIGLLVGTLDITAAFISAYITNGATPAQVLKYIASGVFGKSAFAGGTSMLLYGLLFHYLIAYGCTMFFFWLYPRMPWMQKNRWLTGMVYALFIWIVTARIIVPLSNTPPGTFRIDRALLAWGILVVAIGWPLSFLAHRFYDRAPN